VDHNLSEDKEDEPIDIPPAGARTVLSAAATSAAATALKDVIDDEVLDDNDSVVHWIGKTIKTVWEPEKIHKQHDADGNRVWTCGHCELVFKQWNHTKALSHCIGGPNIQRCKKMSPEWRNVYATIRSDKNYKMVSKELAEAGLAASIEGGRGLQWSSWEMQPSVHKALCRFIPDIPLMLVIVSPKCLIFLSRRLL
jgi:hypothetical protein